MTSLLTSTIFLCLLIFPSINASESWIIYKDQNGIITNQGVKRYAEYLYLSDQKKIHLFNQSNKDYALYLEKKEKWHKQVFKKTLKKMLYQRLIEKKATFGSPKKWEAFQITNKSFKQEVQNFKNKSFLSKGLAEIQFAQSLAKKGWPTPPGSTLEEVYSEWIKSHEFRLKELLREREVKKYERIAATRSNPNLEIPLSKISKFYKVNKKSIEQSIQKKYLFPHELQKRIQQEKAFDTLVEKTQFFGLSSSSIKEVKLNAPPLFKEFQERVNKEILPNYQNELEKNILRYENMAQRFSFRDSKEKIKELLKKAQSDFFKTNDYNLLMLSHIYQAALLYQGESSKDLKSSIKKITKSAILFLKNKKRYLDKEYQNLRIEDALGRFLSKKVENEALFTNQPYLKKILGLSIWAMKFEIKKVSRSIKSLAKVTFQKFNQYETQEKIRNYLKKELLMNKIEKFKKENIAQSSINSLSIRIKRNEIIKGQKAIDFIFN